MKRTNKSILLLLFLLLSACSKRISSVDNSVSLVVLDSIHFSLDESTYYLSKAIFQFEEKEKEYLFFENTDRGKSQILIFDIEKQQLLKSVPLYKEGPNGISGILGGWPIDISHFLITTKSGRFHLIDDEGNILKTLEVWNKKNFGTLFGNVFVLSYFYQPAIIKDSLFYFVQESVGYPHKKKEDWKNFPMFAYANLKEGTVARTELCFPSIFDEDEQYKTKTYPTYISYAYTGKELAVSFVDFDSIMVSSDFKNAKFHNAQSRYFPQIRPKIYDIRIDLVTYLKKTYRQPSYHHLIYDKYRKVFYRFALMPYELSNDESPFKELPGREFSIIILNNKYEVIGETKFPGKKYLYNACFVGKKGLYISLNNEKNPRFNENELKFECFVLHNNK